MKNKYFWGSTTLFIVLLSSACIYQIQIAQNDINKIIDLCLKNAITKDYNFRIVSESKNESKHLDRKVKRYTIVTERGNESIIFKDSIEEQLANELVNQYAMPLFAPIRPDKFNEIFAALLKEEGINKKTGIIYYHYNKPQYSANDSITPYQVYRTHRKMLDIKNTVSIQAWVDYDWRTILKFTKKGLLFGIIGVYITIVLFILLIPSKIKKQISGSNMLRSGNMKLDVDKKRLLINGHLCKINKMDFELLKMFVEAPEHYLIKDVIKDHFWHGTDINVDNKLNAHISSLRKVLRDFPGYELKSEKMVGYQLLVPEGNGSGRG